MIFLHVLLFPLLTFNRKLIKTSLKGKKKIKIPVEVGVHCPLSAMHGGLSHITTNKKIKKWQKIGIESELCSSKLSC